MTRSLRARHRLAFAVLALGLPAGWIAALCARRPEPVAAGAPLLEESEVPGGAPAEEPFGETER